MPETVRVDRRASRLAAVLLLAGQILFVAAGLFHPAREAANDHPAVFAEYALSRDWTAIHLGQFAGMAVAVAGLIVLAHALDARSGPAAWAARLGGAAAAATLALYAVLQAVDGVALKQAVDAWAAAPEAQKAARFAGAEAVRWLEWGVRSYQSFLLGLTFALLAASILAAGGIPRAIGVLMALAGAGWLAQGWVLGSQGFAAAFLLPTLLCYVCWLAASVWLLVTAWPMGHPTRAAGAGQPNDIRIL